MKKIHPRKTFGFTLMETVIAIGVLAVMLTAFMGVFAPAAKNIRRAINVQDADRLASGLEKELGTFRRGDLKSGAADTAFNKAYSWIQNSHSRNTVILCYQYRGNPSSLRADGSMAPYIDTNGQSGKDFVVQSIYRLRSDALVTDDLKARVGRIFFVKLTQLIMDNTNGLVLGTPGNIQNPPALPNSIPLTGTGADGYNDATIPFVAEFYDLPSTDPNFVTKFDPATYPIPLFSRNMAVRR
jgi:type II secretory pathway pseudopilin PulG